MPQEWAGTIAIEGEPTGDGRMLERDSIYWDDDPIALVFDRAEGDHTAAVVGRVTRIWRDGDNIMAEGDLSESEDPETQGLVVRAAELLAEGAVGVSVRLDNTDVEIRVDKALLERLEEMPEDVAEDGEVEREEDEDGRVVVARWSAGEELEVTTRGRVRHVAIVDTAAFAEARIALVAALDAGGWAWDRTVIASLDGIDLDAFANPGFGMTDGDDGRLTAQRRERPDEGVAYGAPLTVTDDGRVFGHAALWGRCHAGFADRCVVAPRGGTYARFLTGAAVPGVATGPITVGTTHAKLSASPSEAMDHYSDTGRAVADVTVGEDRHGIWVAGRLRPGVSEEDVAALRGSSLSGDWRAIGGTLQLVGLLAVNSPGFLVERAQPETDALAASLITAGPCDCADPLVAAAGFTGAVVALLPTAEDAERLAQDGYEPQDRLHVTVAFMGDAADIDDDRRQTILTRAGQVAQDTPAFSAEAFAPALFNPASDDPASVLLVQAAELAQVRQAFEDVDASDHPVYFPHLTVGYEMSDDDHDVLDGLVGPVAFDRLLVGFADDVTVVNLAPADDGEAGQMTIDGVDLAASNGHATADVDSNGVDVAQLTQRIQTLERREAERMRADLANA